MARDTSPSKQIAKEIAEQNKLQNSIKLWTPLHFDKPTLDLRLRDKLNKKNFFPIRQIKNLLCAYFTLRYHVIRFRDIIDFD